MGEPEPSSSESEDDVDQDDRQSLISDDMNPNTSQPLYWTRPVLEDIHHLISYSFIISTILDGLIHLFFPLATISDNTAFSTLFRSTGIYSLTLSIISAGIIRSLNGRVELVSIFLFAAGFHCTAS